MHNEHLSFHRGDLSIDEAKKALAAQYPTAIFDVMTHGSCMFVVSETDFRDPVWAYGPPGAYYDNTKKGD